MRRGLEGLTRFGGSRELAASFGEGGAVHAFAEGELCLRDLAVVEVDPAGRLAPVGERHLSLGAAKEALVGVLGVELLVFVEAANGVRVVGECEDLTLHPSRLAAVARDCGIGPEVVPSTPEDTFANGLQGADHVGDLVGRVTGAEGSVYEEMVRH